MTRFWKRIPQTVRPRSARRTPVFLCLAVFGLTAAVVYVWGRESGTPTKLKPTHTATAYVVERPNQAGELHIPLEYSAESAQRAEEVANSLAERYVDDRRVEWQRRMEGQCANAHETFAATRRELAQNENRLETFRQETAVMVANPQAVGQQHDEPPMIDNPERLDLDRQITELEQHRDNLLVDRTPLHPAVRDIVAQIEDLQRQRASLPPQVPGTRPSTPDAPAIADQTATQRQARMNELVALVEASRQACATAETAEKLALDQQQAGPPYAIVSAQVVENQSAPHYDWWRLLGTTLAAGAMMAFGLGSVSAGANIDPPLASAAQVRCDTGAPIVGTIPADDPMPDPAYRYQRLASARRTRIAIGLLLMAAAPLAVIWGITGI